MDQLTKNYVRMIKGPETKIITVLSDVEQLKGCALFDVIESNCSVRIRFRESDEPGREQQQTTTAEEEGAR